MHREPTLTLTLILTSTLILILTSTSILTLTPPLGPQPRPLRDIDRLHA